MKLKEIVDTVGLEVRSAADKLDADILGGYASDLLSDVIANAGEGDLWVTLQIHPNIIAVASMKGIAAVVVINGREPEEETLKKAAEESIPVLVSRLPAFELIGKLHALGIPGTRDGIKGV